MRARAIREGSVGLLILIGVGLFGGLVLWLRGLNPGNRNYTMTITFEQTTGMQAGTAVRYRGVPVGRVVDIRPSSNMVDVLVEITQADLRIPEAVIVSTNQSGFIGETTIDITPNVELTESEQAVSPTGSDCQAGVIVCDGDRLVGVTGVSFESLLRSAETLATTLSDPALINSLKTTLTNAAVFTDKASNLTEELTELTLSAQGEIRPISDSVQRATNNAAAAAQEFELTAADIRTLVAANRLNLETTLTNLSRGSDRLAYIMETLATEVETTDFINNLEILSANAAEASVNFRDASVDVRALTGSLNQPENRLLIQQTLESARNVFDSAQKILSDVDELTGDPTIRNNIRDVLNGLSNLLSSTEMLEQQAELAIALEPLTNLPAAVAVPLPAQAASPLPPLTLTDYQALHEQLQALSALTNTPPAPQEQP